jgi:hypothetical protein
VVTRRELAVLGVGLGALTEARGLIVPTGHAMARVLAV